MEGKIVLLPGEVSWTCGNREIVSIESEEESTLKFKPKEYLGREILDIIDKYLDDLLELCGFENYTSVRFDFLNDHGKYSLGVLIFDSPILLKSEIDFEAVIYYNKLINTCFGYNGFQSKNNEMNFIYIF